MKAQKPTLRTRLIFRLFSFSVGCLLRHDGWVRETKGPNKGMWSREKVVLDLNGKKDAYNAFPSKRITTTMNWRQALYQTLKLQ